MDNIYKTILEDALAGFWDWNLISNEEYLSPSFKAMFGYADHELENRPESWQKLIFPDDLAKVSLNLAAHIESRGSIPYHNEVRYRHKNGSTVWVICTGRVIEWGQNREALRMVGCHIDATPQKLAQQKITDTEKLMARIGEMAKVGGWEIDLLENKIYWTTVTREILGVGDDYNHDYDPITGQGIKFTREGSSRKLIIEAVRAAVETGKSFDEELEIVTPDGTEKWIRAIGYPDVADGKCSRLYGTFQDIDKQKRIQEELAISEKQFRGIFEHSTIGMALVSAEGKCLMVNKELSKILGYTEAELLVKTFEEYTHPDDFKTDIDLFKRLLNGEIESYNLEKRYINKIGEIIWVWLTVSPVKDADGKTLHFVSQIKDITERVLAENKLKAVNNELSGIFNSSTHVAILATDITGIVKNFNRGAEIMLGYSASEVVNQFTPEIIHDPAEVIQKGIELSKIYGKEIKGFDVFVENAKRGKFDSSEWTYKRKDGSTFPVQLVVTPMMNENDQIAGFLAIATDISALKQIERALRDSEQRWQFAIEGTGDGLWDLNLITNESFHSAQCDAMIGFAAGEFGGLRINYEARIHPDDKKTHDDELQAYIAGKKTGVYINQHRVMCKDGTYKWILDRGKIIEWSAGGKPVRMIGTHSDITEQKEREEQLRMAFDIVSEQNNRLLNFAHIVSHNLRSHAGNFQMLMEMVTEPDILEDEKRNLLKHLKNVSAKLNETITNLNDVVTIQTNINLQKVVVNLNAYIAKTLDVLSGDISRNKIMIKNKVPENYKIKYNPAYLESILLNFISNGIKYRSPHRQPELSIECYNEDGHDILIFEDNGVGIDLAMHGDTLFGMYKTFHGNHDAKGIGLFITKNQIEALGGHIEVQSEVDKGTQFKIYLS